MSSNGQSSRLNTECELISRTGPQKIAGRDISCWSVFVVPLRGIGRFAVVDRTRLDIDARPDDRNKPARTLATLTKESADLAAVGIAACSESLDRLRWESDDLPTLRARESVGCQ